jgi:hypothetical protein
MTEPHQLRLHPEMAKAILKHRLQDLKICKNLDDVVINEQTMYGARILTLRELILRALEQPPPTG